MRNCDDGKGCRGAVRRVEKIRNHHVLRPASRLTFESDFAAIVRLLPQLGYARDNGVEGGSRTKTSVDA